MLCNAVTVLRNAFTVLAVTVLCNAVTVLRNAVTVLRTAVMVLCNAVIVLRNAVTVLRHAVTVLRTAVARLQLAWYVTCVERCDINNRMRVQWSPSRFNTRIAHLEMIDCAHQSDVGQATLSSSPLLARKVQ